MSSRFTLHTVTSARDLREFLDVPVSLYRHDPHWVQPLYSERRSHFGPGNPYFAHAEVRFRIARDEQGRPVGRLSSQHDRLAQPTDGRREGHFGLLEAADAEVMGVLLADAESWCRERGLARIVGPYSLSINDESGLLVEGFDSPPRLMMNYAPRWYGPALESLGYAKAKDLLSFVLDLEREPPAGAVRLAERAHTIPGFVERPLRLDRFDAELHAVGTIFNDAWSANWGYVPLTPEEIHHLGKNLKPLVNAQLARFIEVDGTPVGMVVALADLNEALRGLGGRLWPLGWARLLWRLQVRRVRAARVILMGVSPAWQKDFRNAAMVAALLVALHRALRRKRFKLLELSWVLEDNKPVIALAQLFGAVVEKRYRLYEKRLA